MAYIGQPLNAGNLAVQTGTGDNTTTPIGSLNYSVGSSESLQVTLDGVDQIPGTDFTASGTSISFTSAVPTGVAIKIRFLALPISLPTPGDGTVSTAKLANDAVTAPKTDLSIVQGDVIYGSGTDAWARLGAGTSGQFLKTQGAGANPVWADATHTGNVAFPATQVASADANTLDDYEEGLWTPTLEGASSSGTTATGTGYYTKIGRLVNVGVRFGNVAVSGGSGEAKISGLPFSVSTVASGAYGVCFPMTYKVTHRGQIDGFYTAGTALYGLSSFSGTGWSGWAFSDFYGSGNIYINLSVSYITT